MLGLPDFVIRNMKPPDFDSALTLLKIVGVEGQPLQALTDDCTRATQLPREMVSQKHWGNVCSILRQKKLEKSLSGSDAIRFSCQTRPHAMAWTCAVPSAGTKTLVPTKEFVALLQWTLGAPVVKTEESNSPGCPRCMSPLDTAGHHLVCCHRNNVVRRHGAVQSFVLNLAQRAGFPARQKKKPRMEHERVMFLSLDSTQMVPQPLMSQ
jgi:hypothetical protein